MLQETEPDGELVMLGHAAAAANAESGTRDPDLAWGVAAFLCCSSFKAAHLFRVTNGEE